MNKTKSAPTANTSPDSTHPTRSNYPRYVFSLLFIISFLNFMDRYVLTGAANGIAKELGFSLDGIGYVTSAFLIIYTLSTIPFGIWADRGQRKDVIAFSVAVWSAVTSLTALATSFSTLFLARMFLGVGEAGYFPAGTALLSDYYNRSKRARVMSFWSIAEMIGVLGGFAIGGALTGLFPGSWRLAFLLTGLPGLVLTFFIWRIREPRRNQADEETALLEPVVPVTLPAPRALVSVPPTRNFRAQFFTLLRIKTLVVLILMQVFAYFVLGVTTAFLPTYLQQKDIFSNFTSASAGLYSGGVVVLAGVVGAFVGGYLSDQLNRYHPGARVLFCGISFLVSAPAFVMAILYHNMIVFTIFFILAAILLRCYNGPCSAATQDVVPSALRASAIAISLLFAHLFGDAFAPTLVGVLATNLDPTHGLHFKASLAGQELSLALVVTCTPALIIAGLIGIFGARWMQNDISHAEQVDRLTKVPVA